MNETAADGPYQSRTADLIFGVMELISGLGGLFLNSATVQFFFKKRSSPTYFLYLCIVVTDILTCLFVIPSSLSMLYYREPLLFSNSLLCIVSGWVLNVTTRMSVYLVAVLSVIRCFTIAPTFSSPSLRHAILPVLVYLVIQIVQASIPLVFSTESPPIYYKKEVAGCSWGINELSFAPYQGTWYKFLLYFCIILPFFFPIFPIVVSCIIFLKIVLTSRKKVKSYRTNMELESYNSTVKVASTLDQSPGHKNIEKPDVSYVERSTFGPHLTAELSQSSLICTVEAHQSKNRAGSVDVAHQATTTVCIVTSLYVIFNVPIWIFTLAVTFFHTDHIEWVITSGIYIHIFLYRTSVVMNAACNSIVYFARIKALRRLWNFDTFRRCSFSRSFQGLWSYWRQNFIYNLSLRR